MSIISVAKFNGHRAQEILCFKVLANSFIDYSPDVIIQVELPVGENRTTMS